MPRRSKSQLPLVPQPPRNMPSERAKTSLMAQTLTRAEFHQLL